MVLQAVLVLVGMLFASLLDRGAMALAILAAGLVSSLDLLLIGLASRRLAAGPVRSRLFYAVALAAKFPLLIAAVYLLVIPLSMDPLGLTLGFSTLVIAILYAAVGQNRTERQGATP
jgi:hypothetical protein